MKITNLLEIVPQESASDLHLTVGMPPTLRIDGLLKPLELPQLQREDLEELVAQLLENEGELKVMLDQRGEVDFAYEVKGIGRFRINIFYQRDHYACALRLIGKQIPSMEGLGLPVSILCQLADFKSGLILVTGPTGSGKSTTLATMLNYINENKSVHLLTLEDPIEFIHTHKKGLVNQREIGRDSKSYETALRAALREDPDVILVGEMRDQKTIEIALTAAETGHLVLSSLHTRGAVSTIERIIDVFPAESKSQVRMQLSSVLKGVISQQLLPKKAQKGRAIALEIMVVNGAIGHLIREAKTHQIYSHLQMGHSMCTMERSLAKLYRQGIIDLGTAESYACNVEELKVLLKD